MTAAASRMELFVIIVNGFHHKVLHLGCCSSPRSTFFSEIFNFLINYLIFTNQSGFKPGDSCINQFLSITRGIRASLDEEWEVRGVFLDISKAFDEVWHVSSLS